MSEPVPVLLDGARTPVGRKGGRLADVPAVDLGAQAVSEVMRRCPGLVPDYIAMGNVVQAGNGQNPARAAAVRGGVPRPVPGITLNDVCLASMSSVALVSQMIRAAEIGAGLVGGFESMTRAPRTVTGFDVALDELAPPESVDLLVRDGLWCALGDIGMGPLSDAENARLGITRDDQDRFAVESHRRAAVATREGRLAEEMIREVSSVLEDEGIRPDSSFEKLASLKPAFTPDGSITAGNSSQMSDAGAAGLVTSLELARASGAQPLVAIAGRAVVAGTDSSLHLQPATASRMLLERHRLSTSDIDLWEVNEAFAGVVLASIVDLDLDLDRVNVNGGAIALGHPLGASGFRLVLTLAYEMRRRGVEWGMAAICGGGGQGEAMLLRAL